MALISEWMQQCGKKVLDNAGIVRDACSQQPATSRGIERFGLLLQNLQRYLVDNLPLQW
jgi:hypothetical protein